MVSLHVRWCAMVGLDVLLPVTRATTKQTRLLPMRDCCSTGVVSMVIA
jgi:hypothetical protein